MNLTNIKLKSYRKEKPGLFWTLAIGAAVVVVLLLGAALGGVKMLQFKAMAAAQENAAQPPETVTTSRAELQNWETTLTAVGSLAAVKGVTIAAEQGGKIESITFDPGGAVEKGDLLVQQDISTEEAQLRAAEADAELAKISLKRSEELLAKNLTSKSEYDAAAAQYKGAKAQVDNIRSLIEKKTIRAPFAGRVGTQKVYVGQYLQPGQPIVTLQSLDPMYVNFMLPQQDLMQIKSGFPVRIESDALSEPVSGKITAVDPEVDTTTRNAAVQATITNPGQELLPGMFVKVSIILPEENEVLSIPATAVVYAPYGASVFVIDRQKNEKTGSSDMIARQQFVKLGKSRGDYVAISSGLKAEDLIVTTGAFKLRNGQTVVENNKQAPEFELNPHPADS